MTLDDATARSWLAVAVEEASAGLAEGGIPIGAALVAAHGTVFGRRHDRRVQDGSRRADCRQAQGALVSRAQIGQARSSPPSGGQSPSTTSTVAPHSARNGGSLRVAFATSACRSPTG